MRRRAYVRRRPPTPPVRTAVVTLTAALVASCGDSFVTEVIGRRPFDPPTVYAEWWSATEGCAGKEGRLERIAWYLAASLSGDGRSARGRWSPPHEIILVAGYEEDELVVRHEMLHDLLEGDRLHRADAWRRCGLEP